MSTSEFERKQALLKAEFRAMKSIKVNFTDVRLSAMEDFVGRGDRTLAPVIRRAWELGAGMDAWWESLERAFAAWGQAIDEAGLSWKYRQVENGDWGINNPEERTSLAMMDLPLPWDHIDTGIDKAWLKADFQKALEAATVPDCSFEGCSHCGICGVDFGHNIAIASPPIPQFIGHYTPNQTRAQRLRVWFGKQNDLALLSHLDLLRLFDRAVRRASLPVTFTGGFHPGPKIAIANALPLGATSSGEIVDFELTAEMSEETFHQQLAAQLPPNLPIYRVENIDLKAPAASALLEKAEYLLTVEAQNTTTPEQWQTWVQAVLECETIWLERTTKSGKVQQVNLRDRLFALEQVETPSDTQAVLRYLGSCRNDGTLLRPSEVLFCLEQVSHQDFGLCHTHRNCLFLNVDPCFAL